MRAVSGPLASFRLSLFTVPPTHASRPSARHLLASGCSVSGRPVTLPTVATSGADRPVSSRSAIPAIDTAFRATPPGSASRRAITRASTSGASSGPASRAVIMPPSTPQLRASAPPLAKVSRASASVQRSSARLMRPVSRAANCRPSSVIDTRVRSPSGPASATTINPPASAFAAAPAFNNGSGLTRPRAPSRPFLPESARSASGAPASRAVNCPVQSRQRPRPAACTLSGDFSRASDATTPPAGASSLASRSNLSRSGSASRCSASVSPAATPASRSTSARPARRSSRPLALTSRCGPAMPLATTSRPSCSLPILISISGRMRGSETAFRRGKRSSAASGMISSAASKRLLIKARGVQSSSTRGALAKRPSLSCSSTPSSVARPHRLPLMRAAWSEMPLASVNPASRRAAQSRPGSVSSANGSTAITASAASSAAKAMRSPRAIDPRRSRPTKTPAR